MNDFLKNIYFKLFPKKSDWVDVGIYYTAHAYYLSQMRIDTNNKKSFRDVKLGCRIDYDVNIISQNILSTNKNDLFQN
jgi:hypothetical protein